MVVIPDGNILNLGGFQFKGSTIPIKTIEKDSNYDWASISRGKKSPAKQWAGIGEKTITLRGVIYPEYNPGSGSPGSLLGPVGPYQLETLELMAASKLPYSLIDGTGIKWGKFIITNINELQEHHLINGVPRKQSFSITLQRYSGELEVKQNLLNRSRRTVRDTRARVSRVLSRVTTLPF